MGRFKVSRPTVGRALRDLQGQDLIERRTGSGTYVKVRSASSVPKSFAAGLDIETRWLTAILIK